MKKTVQIIIIVFSLSMFSSYAQVAINTDGTAPDGSAMLEVKSTDKGMLVPRMSTDQRTSISSPSKGLLVFDNNTSSFWFYNGSSWVEITGGGSNSWTAIGNNISNSNSGNVGIGTNSPGTRFQVGDLSTETDEYITVASAGGNTSVSGIKLRHFNDTYGFTIESNDKQPTQGFNIRRHSNSIAGESAVFIEASSGNLGVGTTAPASSAKLEVSSTSSGFLPPRMTLEERDAISAPAAGLMIFNTSFNKPNYFDGTEWLNFDGSSAKLAIGDFYKGGIVFYLDGSGGGLICALTDQSSGIQWYNGSYTITGATATEIGSGQANTTTIINNQGAGSYAATVCDNYSFDGYSDWFLPSKDEIDQIYQNRTVINSAAIANGGAAIISSGYWTSSEHNEYSPDDAWYQTFHDGYKDFNSKDMQYRVRAVRAF